MDRRFKNYYIVTFKRHYNYYSFGSGYLTDSFYSFPRFIKVHWRSINGVPYALVSVGKHQSEIAVSIFRYTFGVDRIISYTEAKERDWDMWQKILRLPENNFLTKRIIQRCMQQDLFIDWLV